MKRMCVRGGQSEFVWLSLHQTAHTLLLIQVKEAHQQGLMPVSLLAHLSYTLPIELTALRMQTIVSGCH